jgi:hypothetical protein
MTLGLLQIAYAKIKKSRMCGCLDFLLFQDFPEGFPAAIKEAYGELCSLSTLVGFASHFPRFPWSCDFFSAIGTFNH